MLWFCGFNGFQQFNHVIDNVSFHLKDETFSTTFIKYSDEPFSELVLSWCRVLIIKDNQATLNGFFLGKPGQSVLLKPPDNQDIIQGHCNQKNCVLVTSGGNCWQFNFDTRLWKEIKYLSADSPCVSRSKRIARVILGEVINAALTEVGSVWNVGSQLSPSEMKVLDINCGKEHGLLLTDSGNVYTWGGGSRGQLGNGSLESSEDLCEVQLLTGLKIIKIAAGGWHNAVISRDGDLYSWGWNKQGQLGHPTLDGNTKVGVAVLSEPRAVDWPKSLDLFVLQVSCGASHTVVLLENGEVWGCGWNKWGQLGTDKFIFTCAMSKLEICPSVSVSKIICGAWNTVIISEDNKDCRG